MAYSSDAAKPARGFLPPQNDDERRLMRRVEELCTLAEGRGIPRYTGFLSDREQALARAAANRADCRCIRFWGGFDGAERQVLCIEPPDAWQQDPVACLRITARLAAGQAAPQHRDLLGAVLGLGLERACLGDIRPDPDAPGTSYLFLLQDKAEFVAANLLRRGGPASPPRAARNRRLPPCGNRSARSCRPQCRPCGRIACWAPCCASRAGRQPSLFQRAVWKWAMCRCAAAMRPSTRETSLRCGAAGGTACSRSAAKAAATAPLSCFFSIEWLHRSGALGARAVRRCV